MTSVVKPYSVIELHYNNKCIFLCTGQDTISHMNEEEGEREREYGEGAYSSASLTELNRVFDKDYNCTILILALTS